MVTSPSLPATPVPLLARAKSPPERVASSALAQALRRAPKPRRGASQAAGTDSDDDEEMASKLQARGRRIAARGLIEVGAWDGASGRGDGGGDKGNDGSGSRRGGSPRQSYRAEDEQGQAVSFGAAPLENLATDADCLRVVQDFVGRSVMLVAASDHTRSAGAQLQQLMLDVLRATRGAPRPDAGGLARVRAHLLTHMDLFEGSKPLSATLRCLLPLLLLSLQRHRTDSQGREATARLLVRVSGRLP